jgi:hypothetical protein
VRCQYWSDAGINQKVGGLFRFSKNHQMVGVLVSGQLFLVFDIGRRLWHWKVVTLNLGDELGQVFLGLQGQLNVVLLADEKLKGNGSRGFKVTWEADWNVDC